MTDENGRAEAAGSEYMVVYRARSAARFFPDEGFEMTVSSPHLSLGPVRLRSFTRWVGEEPLSLPRELIVEARGPAASLDDAVTRFSAFARPVATMAAFVANVRVGPLDVHLAYDCSPDQSERLFMEAFVPDEQGGLTSGRRIRPHLMAPACTASIGLTVDSARVDRALRQYELALREWYLGGQWLALSHLWIASENLTKAVVRKLCTEQELTEEGLAHTYDVATDDPAKQRWSVELDARVRSSVIFDGDVKTYKTAKAASDGLEHGFLEFNKITANALQCTDKTFRYVRQTILSLLALPDDLAAELLDISPRDVQSDRKVIRGRLLGDAEDLAEKNELYPLLEWNSAIKSVVHDGERFVHNAGERITVRTHPDVRFQMDSLELIGRLEAGEATRQLSDEEVEFEEFKNPAGPKLMDRAQALIDGSLSVMGEAGFSFPGLLAFQLFSHGVASFQSVPALVAAMQPVEAMPSLRTLTLIAARFEQMAPPDGAGFGLVLRMNLDWLEGLGADEEVVSERRQEVVSAAERAGVVPAEALPDPQDTAVYRGLGAEMALAAGLIEGTYGVLAQHLSTDAAGLTSFRTHLEPGPFTDMVSSAAVIAAMTLLQFAAALFGWELDGGAVGELLTESRELNEESANA